MKIEVHFYAQLRDFFGDSLSLELSEAATVATLFTALTEKNALAADWLKVSRAASDEAFLTPDTLLTAGARCYILPPSSGG
ncbi:MoaD/ThiS family protein [Turneriella parva]|uniref:Thiamine S protein n=1 Tax=Turneriella parva (strain ATCC BAA-1111 / DSM 21527 / NCTC 11395 / H) TaxID=869212 RepID=I4B770_TURPD|nr:MoaD/ThiS family protein [Turneriella parva]AFM13127.1 thiamine S protein [Turneriella parva DSM 21527]